MIRSSHPPIEGLRSTTNPQTALEPLTIRVSAAVRLSGLSRSHIYELINSGALVETHKVGRATLIAYRSLKHLVGADD